MPECNQELGPWGTVSLWRVKCVCLGGVWRVYEGVRFGVSGDVEVRALARIFR